MTTQLERQICQAAVQIDVNLTRKERGIRTGPDLTIDDLASLEIKQKTYKKDGPVHAQHLLWPNGVAVRIHHPDQDQDEGAHQIWSKDDAAELKID